MQAGSGRRSSRPLRAAHAALHRQGLPRRRVERPGLHEGRGDPGRANNNNNNNHNNNNNTNDNTYNEHGNYNNDNNAATTTTTTTTNNNHQHHYNFQRRRPCEQLQQTKGIAAPKSDSMPNTSTIDEHAVES